MYLIVKVLHSEAEERVACFPVTGSAPLVQSVPWLSILQCSLSAPAHSLSLYR